jgi:16S rRNA (adenine1518-N6/adenine1519-N6)-dimethyltransferase
MAQYAADITKSFRVSAQCFRPRPEVASAVVLLRTNAETRLSQQKEVAFRALVKAAFAHRRKTLVNSLRDEGYELHRVAGTLQRLEIGPTRRAETLSVEDFLRLTLALG